jgi:hypothetical protein
MTTQPVTIQGTGVAALCAHQLLKQNAPNLDSIPRLPAILLSQSTQTLLTDIFKNLSLFAKAPRIRQRIVAWASHPAIAIPHDAIVLSENTLLETLHSQLQSLQANETKSDPPHWTILTSRSAPELRHTSEKAFGARTAKIQTAQLTENAEPETCWIESTKNGWLFLLTTSPGAGSLLSVGENSDSQLQHSRLIAPQLSRLDPIPGAFPAHPRILDPLCAAGWLAAGSAAVAFDPLCGEGAGNAAREAILACAAVRAIHAGESTPDVLLEYATRLTLGFLRHLENCREFYLQDSASQFWQDALSKIDEGLTWTRARLAAAPPPAFRLVDFALQRRPPPNAVR